MAKNLYRQVSTIFRGIDQIHAIGIGIGQSFGIATSVVGKNSPHLSDPRGRMVDMQDTLHRHIHNIVNGAQLRGVWRLPLPELETDAAATSQHRLQHTPRVGAAYKPATTNRPDWHQKKPLATGTL